MKYFVSMLCDISSLGIVFVQYQLLIYIFSGEKRRVNFIIGCM